MGRRRGKRKDTLAARGCGALFFFVFFAFGAGFLVLLGKGYVDEIRVGRTWEPVPCTLLEKKMLTSRSSDGNSHRPEFRFRYEYEGETYEATGYKVMKVSSSRGWAHKRLDRYTVGNTYTCWVNPRDPRQAVIEHGVGWGWLFLLLPLVFMAVGGIGVVAMFMKRTRRPGAAGNKAVDCFPKLKTSKGKRLRVALRPEHSVAARILGFALLALFWNGIAWTAMVAVLRQGGPLPVKFMIGLFPLIGLFLIGLFVHKVLYAILTGDPQVEIEREPLAPGAESEVLVRHPGVRELNSGEVKLICREKAWYRQGTRRVMKSDNVVEESVALIAPNDVRNGVAVSARIELPASAMHSFKASNNAIEWCFEVVLDIPGKPDVKLVFPFRVENGKNV